MPQTIRPNGSERRRAFVTNLASFYTSDALQLALYILITPYLLRYLGKSQYGLLAVADSVLGYLGLLNLGLTPVLTRHVAASEAVDDTQRSETLMSTAFTLFGALGLVGMLLAFGVALTVGQLFHIEQPLVPACAAFLAIKGCEFAIATPLQVYAAGNYAMQNMVILNTIRGVTGIVDALGIFLIVHFDLGLRAIAVLALLNAALSGWLNRRSLRRVVPNLRVRVASASRKCAQELVGYSAFFALDTVIVLIVLKTDEIVIAGAIGSGAVAIYAIVGQTSRGLMSVASRISGTLYPSYAALAERQDFQQLRGIFRRAMDATLFVSAGLSVLFIAFFAQLLEFWLGLPAGEVPQGVVAALGAVIMSIAPVTVASRYIGAVGLIQRVAVISVVEGAANLALSLLLIGRLGLTGVALGTLLTQTATTTWFNPSVALSHQNVSQMQFWPQRILRLLLVCLPSATLAFVLSHYHAAQSLVELTVQMLACGGLHAISAYLVWQWPSKSLAQTTEKHDN